MLLNNKDSWEIKVEAEHHGLRLDFFLAVRLPQFSRAQLTQFIKAGNILINKRPTKPSQKVITGQEYFVVLPKTKHSFMEPENIALEILYNDDHIAVINKPQGLTVHPGAGIKNGTLCNALLHHFPEIKNTTPERPGIVHRLDKDTAGIMLIAKSEAALRILSNDFKQRRVKKIYRVLCHGEIPQKQFSLITGHARHPQHRLKFTTKLLPPKVAGNVRLAHTDFLVEKRAFGISVVSATLHTGRTHQIRAHLSDYGFPILGDGLYGGRKSLINSAPVELRKIVEELRGQALFAEKLAFTHPITQDKLAISAHLPPSFISINNLLNE